MHSSTHRRAITPMHVLLEARNARSSPSTRAFSDLMYIPTGSRGSGIFLHRQCIENAEKGCELSALHMPERREDPHRSRGNSGFWGVNSPSAAPPLRIAGAGSHRWRSRDRCPRARRPVAHERGGLRGRLSPIVGRAPSPGVPRARAASEPSPRTYSESGESCLRNRCL